MTRNRFKIGALVGAVLLVVLAATAATAREMDKSQVPEYVGSQACLGCHTEKNIAWEESLHHTSFKLLDSPADFPGDLSTVSPELMAELQKADFLWRGKRFVAQDPVTGEYTYTKVEFDKATSTYKPYKGGVFSASCGGCHSGAVNAGVHTTRIEPGISCESCHGPGRDHILGKGEVEAIVSSTVPSETCAQCHSGYNQLEGGTRHAAGYRPGQPIEEFEGFKAVEYDPEQAPPFLDDNNHLEQYPQWKASGHAIATNTLIERGPKYLARQECIYCHSTAAGIQIKGKGQVFDPATDLVNDGVSCIACHDSHGGTGITAQLKMEPQALCVSCHSVGRGKPEPQTIGTVRPPHAPSADMLWGQAAIGIAPTKGAHSEITCIECHMTEGNHMMKVVKPADAMGVEGRVDSCTKCHSDSSAESRGIYLELWKESIDSRLAAIASDVELIDARLKDYPEALTGADLELYKNARANFWYVRKDNSGGAHNFEYAIKILTQVQKDMITVKIALK
ncbi:MAG: multiheme c-type cytochrome [Bacillota bacterium]